MTGELYLVEWIQSQLHQIEDPGEHGRQAHCEGRRQRHSHPILCGALPDDGEVEQLAGTTHDGQDLPHLQDEDRLHVATWDEGNKKPIKFRDEVKKVIIR